MCFKNVKQNKHTPTPYGLHIWGVKFSSAICDQCSHHDPQLLLFSAESVVIFITSCVVVSLAGLRREQLCCKTAVVWGGRPGSSVSVGLWPHTGQLGQQRQQQQQHKQPLSVIYPISEKSGYCHNSSFRLIRKSLSHMWIHPCREMWLIKGKEVGGFKLTGSCYRGARQQMCTVPSTVWLSKEGTPESGGSGSGRAVQG